MNVYLCNMFFALVVPVTMLMMIVVIIVTLAHKA